MLVVVSLTGCGLVGPNLARVPSLSQTQASLYTLKSWRMDGRIGVQTGSDAWQANLFWEHDATQDRLRVSGPLSQGMVSIVIQQDLIFINLGEGRTELSHNPEALLRERLGFSVPLPSLRYWILGLPDPARAYTTASGGGPWNGFQQSGWTVVLERFLDVGSRLLPQKIRVQGGEVRLKIVADNWEIEG